MRLGRLYHFAASHRLHAPGLSQEVNRELYGKCNNPYGHGHDYTIEVALRGEVDQESGALVPVAALDRLVESRILKHVRDGNLNLLPEFATLVPTTENLAIVMAGWLGPAWSEAFPHGPALEGVRIRETPRNTVEMRLA